MYAFSDCDSLISMTIPESVFIDDNAFDQCENLKYVSAPAHIVNNPGNAFSKCPRLDDGTRGLVLSTPTTRLKVLRLQHFHPSTVAELYCEEQRAFVMTMMLVGIRHNSPNNSLPSIPNEVLVLILQQLRIQELAPRAEIEEDVDDDGGG